MISEAEGKWAIPHNPPDGEEIVACPLRDPNISANDDGVRVFRNDRLCKRAEGRSPRAPARIRDVQVKVRCKQDFHCGKDTRITEFRPRPHVRSTHL